MERSWGKPLSYKSDPKKKLTFLVKYFNYNNELHYVKLKFVATEWTTPHCVETKKHLLKLLNNKMMLVKTKITNNYN